LAKDFCNNPNFSRDNLFLIQLVNQIYWIQQFDRLVHLIVLRFLSLDNQIINWLHQPIKSIEILTVHFINQSTESIGKPNRSTDQSKIIIYIIVYSSTILNFISQYHYNNNFMSAQYNI
jgi:hypothetical protein